MHGCPRIYQFIMLIANHVFQLAISRCYKMYIIQFSVCNKLLPNFSGAVCVVHVICVWCVCCVCVGPWKVREEGKSEGKEGPLIL